MVSPSLDKRGQEFDGAGMADAWRELIEGQLGGWEVTFCYGQVWSRAAPCQVIWEISLRARQRGGMQDSGWLSVAHLLPLSLLKLHLVGGVCLSPQFQFNLCHLSSAGPPPPPAPGVSAQPPPPSPAALGFRKLDKQSPGRGALCLPGWSGFCSRRAVKRLGEPHRYQRAGEVIPKGPLDWPWMPKLCYSVVCVMSIY